MHRARAAVDSHIEIALASFTITGLQLRQMFDVDVNKTKIILFKGPLSLYRLGRNRSGSAGESLCLQNAPDAVAIQRRQKMGDHEGEVIQSKVGAAAQSADHRPFFLGRFPGWIMRPGGMVQTIL